MRINSQKMHGVTLVALVVTIIVLLILAGVSVSMVLGQQGIFNKAGHAKNVTEISDIKEQIRIEILEKKKRHIQQEITEEQIDEIAQKYGNLSGEGTEKSVTTANGVIVQIADIYEENLLSDDAVRVGKIVTGENKSYTKNGTAVIPVGFAIVPGCDDVSEGLVISDKANDTANTGNQFVWIPVTEMSNFVRKQGYFNRKRTKTYGV